MDNMSGKPVRGFSALFWLYGLEESADILIKRNWQVS